MLVSWGLKYYQIHSTFVRFYLNGGEVLNVQSYNAVLSLQLSMKQFPNGSQIDIADNVFLILALDASGISKCIAYIFITKCCSCGFSNSLSLLGRWNLLRAFSSTAQCRQKSGKQDVPSSQSCRWNVDFGSWYTLLLLFSFLQDSEVKCHCIQCIFFLLSLALIIHVIHLFWQMFLYIWNLQNNKKKLLFRLLGLVQCKGLCRF